MTWVGHPEPPHKKPTVNAAVTLQEFIDATGSDRNMSKTPKEENLTLVYKQQ
jgi:hypothetical protein